MTRTSLLVLLAPFALVACSASSDVSPDASSRSPLADAGADVATTGVTDAASQPAEAGSADPLRDAGPVQDADVAACPGTLPCAPTFSCYDGCNWWSCGADGGFFATTDLACPPKDASASD